MPPRSLRSFTVLPHLPDRLQGLQKLAYNLWWCWNHEAVALFRRIDDQLFDKVENSPVKLLATIDQDRLEQLLHDDGFLAHMDRVVAGLNNYLAARTWFQETYGGHLKDRQALMDQFHLEYLPAEKESQALLDRYRIAYFSAEFGIHESIPIYSGGLGLLAGDHLKAASNLGIPLVGVGLMYREGYFRQYLNVDGWQQERYPDNDFFNLPLIAETKPDGSPLLVSVPMPGREVWMRIWRIQVGRIPLYLLDTNIPQNNPDDRQITARLYGGDHDMRVRQEMVLGIGGIRALRALGKKPTVCHMNEGHSAFCGLERIQRDDGGTEARLRHGPGSRGGRHLLHHAHPGAGRQRRLRPAAHPALFRPVPVRPQDRLAGVPRPGPAEPARQQRIVLHDRAGHSPVEHHQRRQQAARQGVAQDVAGDLAGTARSGDPDHARSPTACTRNPGWPPEMSQLYDRYLGVQWEERPTDHSIWRKVDNIPNAGTVAHPRTPPRTAGGLRPAAAAGPARNAAAPRRPRSPAPRKCSIPRP